MNDAELGRQLASANTWWRSSTAWVLDDPDLASLRDAPLEYEPQPLNDIVPGALYVLRGPRRVGKSIEVKRMISRLLNRGVDARRIIHFACDGLKAKDLRQLQRVAHDQLTTTVAEPRYWFLDEITAVEGWPAEIKWLRDNSPMRRDCVVLTGSSSRDLDEARKALADRRGTARHSDRLLMPMSFKSFVRAMSVELPDLPRLRPKDFLGEEAKAAVNDLMPWLDTLVSQWEVYCRVGGFPRAVATNIKDHEVDPSFVRGLWDVIHGDALQRTQSSSAESLLLISRLSKNLASPVSMSAVANDLGVGSHNTAKGRIGDLIQNYLAWPCHQAGDSHLPNLNAQAKVYFTDPLLARIPHLRSDQPDPDTSVLTEQQIGLALSLSLAAEDPERYSDFVSVMYVRTATKREIDFSGRDFVKVPFEGKYSDDGLGRDTQTIRARFQSGVLATRAVFRDDRGVRLMPAAFVALLLN